jgi:hypothetical protein
MHPLDLVHRYAMACTACACSNLPASAALQADKEAEKERLKAEKEAEKEKQKVVAARRPVWQLAGMCSSVSGSFCRLANSNGCVGVLRSGSDTTPCTLMWQHFPPSFSVFLAMLGTQLDLGWAC